jgi:urate oxidase
MDEVFHGYDSYKEYQQTLELFQEVKEIVYETPNRLLSDTKRELEERANLFKEKRLPYAFFYAAAVVNYWLKK